MVIETDFLTVCLRNIIRLNLTPLKKEFSMLLKTLKLPLFDTIWYYLLPIVGDENIRK